MMLNLLSPLDDDLLINQISIVDCLEYDGGLGQQLCLVLSNQQLFHTTEHVLLSLKFVLI